MEKLMRKRGWAVTGLGTLVLLLAACGGSSISPGSAYGTSPASPMPSGSSSGQAGNGQGRAGTSGSTSATAELTIKKTSIGDVLTNAKDFTLYWYAKDHKGGQPACTGTCLSSWPAVAGRPAAAMDVKLTGKLGSVTRPGGTVQATYNGYPLYTYSGDTAPGQTTGNGVGGVWHVITGSTLTGSRTSGSASSGSASSGSGSSGYGSGY
jgi:predicted lipoprotein with Yx(FWY)xxD motif